MIQSGGFLVRLLGSLLKAGLSIMKIMIKPLPKIAFIQLGLTEQQQQQMQEYRKIS